MFAYYLGLSLRSLRRNPVLTALMVMAIGFGVAASMTTYAVFRVVSGNPLPDKSSQLFVPQIDNWGPVDTDNGEPPDAMDYTDAMALMHAHAASRQTLVYSIKASVVPAQRNLDAFTKTGYATFGDFFSMFEVPFTYGAGWTAEQDNQHAAVAVLSRWLNEKLFQGANSVGREVNLDGHDYRVVGVTADWNPTPRFFEANNTSGFGEPGQFYVPFNRAIDLKLDTGDYNCPGQTESTGWDDWLRGECVWISSWVELPTKAAAAKYRLFLENYSAQQRLAGRFGWAPNVRLRDLMAWLRFERVVPAETEVSLVLALSFLVICLVNTVGLMLAKFMRRAPEIGVRRALGASRSAIHMQYVIEAGTVGLAGGVLGIALTVSGMYCVHLVFAPEIARLAHLDASLLALTLLVAIAATVLAAFYPAWRAAQVQPAWQLKAN
jgi:putative ABC transport system permease protein